MRYVIRPLASEPDPYDNFSTLIEGRTVYEPEPVKTGILDKDGNMVWRVVSPIGFVVLKERG